jgi:Zn-dependent membrane protease YugP
MYGYGMAGFFWDPTYILIIIGAVICMIASARVRTTYSKYSQFRSNSGMTGAEAAERILHSQGIYDVAVQHVSGNLTDHYDPRNRTLSLSDATYGSASVAAVGVAAHECGHAVQHARNYVPLRIRGAMVPVVNFGATLSWPLIIIGILMSRSLAGHYIINLGIILFSLVVLFQLVTLPVEFNASRRAVRILEEQQILDSEELVYTRRVLRAAAMTYVASAAAAILQLLRILLIADDRDD